MRHCACFLLLIFCALASAATPLTTQRVATGLSEPVYVTASPGDKTRLFILEQYTGRVRILNLADNTLVAAPFLAIPNLPRGSEQGLLGLAFHPLYASNGYFFVNYTAANGDSFVERYTVSSDPNLANPNSRLQILTVDQPEANHNGGWLGFGTDGMLYIALGDGGGGNDRHGTIGNAQDRGSLLGKMLRIDVDAASPYAIPEGNPFKGHATFRPEIWAFGLRNPWRASFDRESGDLWIGDVGQVTREEIDLNPAGVAGLNFGWRPREGSIQNPAYPNERPVTAAMEPVYDYGRADGISVTGGYVYRGSAIPDLSGTYIFADFGSARVFSFKAVDGSVSAFRDLTAEINSSTPQTPVQSISSFGEDASGELYIVDYGAGEVRKIVPKAARFEINELRGRVRLKPPPRDMLSLRGVLSELPDGFDPTGKSLTLDVGGVLATFTLDNRGRARTRSGSFALGRFQSDGSATFSCMLKHDSFAAEWSDEGVDLTASVKRQPVGFSVNLRLDAMLLTTTVAALYSGKAGVGKLQ